MTNKNVPLSVLFVCTANVCRSPMAEAIFRQRLTELDRIHEVKVASAGTMVPPALKMRVDLRAQKIVSQYGMDVSRYRSRPLVPSDLQTFQYVLVMDRKNLQQVQDMADGPVWAQVKLLSEFSFQGKGEDIHDPYFGSFEHFQQIFFMIDDAVQGFIQTLGIAPASSAVREVERRPVSLWSKPFRYLIDKYHNLQDHS